MIRVQKRTAKKLYNAGETIYICACLINPRGNIGAAALPTGEDWERLINEFVYYNCNFECGKYPAFYIEEGKQ